MKFNGRLPAPAEFVLCPTAFAKVFFPKFCNLSKRGKCGTGHNNSVSGNTEYRSDAV